MKTVIAPAGATNEFSTAVLVGDVEAQSRWTLGSLCAGILAQSALPMLLALQHAGQGLLSLRAFNLPLAGVNLAAVGATDDCHLVISRVEGASKSRAVVIEIPAGVATPAGVTLNAVAYDPANLFDLSLAGLIANVTIPNYTLLGILNRLEAYLDTLGPDFLLIVDQETEKIYLWLAATAIPGSFPDLLLSSLAGNDDGLFSLTVDETAAAIPGYGWE